MSYKGVGDVTDRQREILGLIQEEAAEIIKAASKVKRYGFTDVNPFDKEKTPNFKLLMQELGDLQALVTLLCKEHVGISHGGIQLAAERKFERLEEWTTLYE